MIKVDGHIFADDYQFFEIIDLKSYYPHNWSTEDYRIPDLKVARDGHLPAGVIATDPSPVRLMRLRRLCVMPEQRRQGIGTALIESVIEDAKDMQISKITTVIRESNLAGALFLKANGFKAVHLMKDHFPDESGYFFKRKL